MSRGGRKSRTKKKKTKVQQAAAKRHANFKKTRVQTFGGTRKSYSVKEADKIDKALGKGSFARVTKGAADPRNRAPDTSGVKVGAMKEEFTTPLSGMSYSQFEGAMKSNPFAPGADRGVSFTDAMRATRGGGLGISRPSTGGFGGTINRKLDTPKDYVPKDIAFNPLKLLRNDTNFEIPAGDGNKIPSATKRQLEMHNYQRQLEGLPPVNKLPDQSSLSGGGNLIASAGDLTGLVHQGVPSAFSVKSPESFGYPSQEAVDRAATTTGGLNFGLSKEESDRLGRVFRDGPSPRMLSQGGDLRFSDMFEADTQGNKMAKGINFVKNLIPVVNRLPDMKINTVAEEAQRQYLGFNPNLPANVLKQQDRRRPNNNRTVYGTQSLYEDQPYYQPVQNAPATAPVQQSGVDPNRLLQIQQQAYAQAFNPMVVGGYNPTFRFGASSPTIDYSSYFNY